MTAASLPDSELHSNFEPFWLKPGGADAVGIASGLSERVR